LQRLDRLQGDAVHHGRADIADDVVRLRQRRVGQQRQHGLKTAAGDVSQLDVRRARHQLIKPLTIRCAAAEKSAVQIGGEKHARSLFSGTRPAIREIPAMAGRGRGS
jgi:hypothetical protein